MKISKGWPVLLFIGAGLGWLFWPKKALAVGAGSDSYYDPATGKMTGFAYPTGYSSPTVSYSISGPSTAGLTSPATIGGGTTGPAGSGTSSTKDVASTTTAALASTLAVVSGSAAIIGAAALAAEAAYKAGVGPALHGPTGHCDNPHDPKRCPECYSGSTFIC